MAKTAALQLSDRFLNTTVHKLIQDIGGAQAGTGFYQASQITEGPGLANNRVRAKEWARLGLVSHGGLEFNKVGDVKGLKAGRGVKDWRLADQSPQRTTTDSAFYRLVTHFFTRLPWRRKERPRPLLVANSSAPHCVASAWAALLTLLVAGPEDSLARQGAGS
jgi:hypothetical protein